MGKCLTFDNIIIVPEFLESVLNLSCEQKDI